MGRPKGSKNVKTREREAEEARLSLVEAHEELCAQEQRDL